MKSKPKPGVIKVEVGETVTITAECFISGNWQDTKKQIEELIKELEKQGFIIEAPA